MVLFSDTPLARGPANFDLYVLKLLKKCVIIQLHGSEVRPPYCDGAIKKHVGDKTELTDFLFLKAIENKNRMEKLQKLCCLEMSPKVLIS